MKMSDFDSLHEHLRKSVDSDVYTFETEDGIQFNVFEHAFGLSVVAKREHDRLTEENEKLREALQWTHDKLIAEGKRYGASMYRAEVAKLLEQTK